jgi:adenylate kinase
MRLILLGPPGAGKGTLAKLLKEALSIPHVSTGDIFREEMNKNSELGLAIKQYVENGSLVPDEVVTQIVEKKVTSPEVERGYMLDGFPRTRKQAEDLDQILTGDHKPIDYVVYMEASLPVIIRRLTGRRVCKNCGALYHMTNKPPQAPGVCDECGGQLYQRPDDNEETIRKRIEIYVQSTAPIIDYYETQNKLTKIDADQDAEIVEKRLFKVFNEDSKLHKNKVAEGN